MPNDFQSGAVANVYGRENFLRLAGLLGASDISGISNECILGSQRVVIKSARKTTNSIGTSNQMIPRIDAIIGAFENDGGYYDLYLLPIGIAQNNMRAKTSGRNANKEALIQKSVFVRMGRRL